MLVLFLYKHNIIDVACITYKQIGGSKQYNLVQLVFLVSCVA